MTAATADERLALLNAKVDSLTRMIEVLAAAPAIKAHVAEQSKVAKIREGLARVARFGEASPAERFEILKAMPSRDRAAFLAEVGLPMIASTVRGLDAEHRAAFAGWLDEATRTAVACAVSDVEVVRVATSSERTRVQLGGSPNAQHGTCDAPLTIEPAPAFCLALGDEWAWRVEEDAELQRHLESGRLLVAKPTDDQAAAARATAIGQDLLRLVGDGFDLERVRFVAARWPGDRPTLVPVAQLADHAAKEKPTPEPSSKQADDLGPKGLAAYHRRLEDASRAKQAEAIAAAVTAAIAKKGDQP